jgi:HEAT repeat protein
VKTTSTPSTLRKISPRNTDKNQRRKALVEDWVKGLQHFDSEIRGETVIALAQYKNVHAIEPLIKMLEQEGNFLVRGHVADTLKQIGDSRIVEPFIKALEHDTHWYVRLIAVEVLGTMGGSQALESLIKALEDEDSSVRITAAEALGKIGEADSVTRALIQALQDHDVTVREKAAEALGKVSGPYAVGALTKTLGDQHKQVRIVATEALATIGNARAVEVLVRKLESKDAQIRKDVAQALGTLDVSAGKYLLRCIENTPSHIQEKLINILKKIGWKPDNDKERTLYKIVVAKGHINIVVFGDKGLNTNQRSHMLVNPDVAEVTIPITTLKMVVIHTLTYRFYQLEQFLTYALNYIGQAYLKKEVKVYIYGTPERLHPNLRNNLTNLCKLVHDHKEDDILVPMNS